MLGGGQLEDHALCEAAQLGENVHRNPDPDVGQWVLVVSWVVDALQLLYLLASVRCPYNCQND